MERGKQIKQPGIIFYFKWKEYLAGMSPEDRLFIYDSIMEYAENGTVPELSGYRKVIFQFMRDDVDRNMAKYQALVERNRANAKSAKAKREMRESVVSTGNQWIPLVTSGHEIKEKEKVKQKEIEKQKQKTKEEEKDKEREHTMCVQKEREKEDGGSATLPPVVCADAQTSPPKRFVPPSVEQVAEYCASRRNSVDSERFVDFYSSKGWKVGSSPMKDWKAAVRTWERRNDNNTVNTNGNGRNTIIDIDADGRTVGYHPRAGEGSRLTPADKRRAERDALREMCDAVLRDSAAGKR